ncbi:iron-siderophore ABC transporter substrate-binding protein [Kineococcus rhizosphaerae]|uniref:Iron complex transport system substrate-binding protein n=1 Tax=Kineococcus rhizosphaerae TaxID=559628 RepID=A0A2T0QXP6_9ACTN|nr:iron-siderophore ABC transporter substrate-binding protein [Kineococcus rhizosphaerae]PRY10807.1 iron complex transport system substrate-binding protein [Kineococcus rhizosphaerae]
MRLSRRHLFAGLLGAGALLPACSAERSVERSGPTATVRRVVALGWGDAETALALGVQPVGAADWLAFGGEGVGPWASGLYDAPPEILGTLEPSYEAIAALEPDLILDVKSSGDPARYETLSAIATTVGVPRGFENYLTPQRDQVEVIAQALDRVERGRDLLQRNDDAFSAAAAAHPGWKGATFTAASRTARGWGAYVAGSERVAFAERLGFVQNPAVAALPVGSSGFSVEVSAERLTVLDADVVVVFPIGVPAEEVRTDPVLATVPAVAAGRSIVFDRDLASAYSLSSILSTRWALDRVVTALEGLGELP